jgi:transcriptional regulator with XRE-family HTH domain
MIRFNLRKCLKLLEDASGMRITLKEVAEKSGCDKNALSRLINHPEIMPSAAVIDKLLQYFFIARKELDKAADKRDLPPIMDSTRMRKVINDFIAAYPDSPEYWEVIPTGMKDDPSLNLDNIWEIYERITNPEPLTKLLGDDGSKSYQRLMEKLDKALKVATEKEAPISLSKQDILFLVDRLPLIIGFTGNDLSVLLKAVHQQSKQPTIDKPRKSKSKKSKP